MPLPAVRLGRLISATVITRQLTTDRPTDRPNEGPSNHIRRCNDAHGPNDRLTDRPTYYRPIPTHTVRRRPTSRPTDRPTPTHTADRGSGPRGPAPATALEHHRVDVGFHNYLGTACHEMREITAYPGCEEQKHRENTPDPPDPPGSAQWIRPRGPGSTEFARTSTTIGSAGCLLLTII